MNSTEIRKKFQNFFEKRGHKVIPSASLVPENDPSVLFTTAGMQQFKGYYTAPNEADRDFGTRNVVSVQKCVRTGDIDEVGDDTHLTFFEMLGNFSFGGYWKKEAIEYAHEFITKELGLTIDYVSVFEGDSETPADEESKSIWKLVNSEIVIKNHNRKDNFWGPTGDEGPCGPTTEIYINGVEVWNIVFNEFYKKKDGKYMTLETKGVDTGMGLERLLVQVQKKNNVYETDLFNFEKTKTERVVADHIKASLFLVSDGVIPSNKESGYVLRRLMRTVASYQNVSIDEIVNSYVTKYSEAYSNLNKQKFLDEFSKERNAYEISYGATGPALLNWQKDVENGALLTGSVAFGISSTLGVRPNDLVAKATELNIQMSPNFEAEFNEAKNKHQELSRTSSTGMFKGGLANTNEQTVKLHTAHHLLLSALQEVLGRDVKQRGSNITEERLRIDFAFSRKITPEELKIIENIVNSRIQQNLHVIRREMPRIEAETLGAEMEFGAKYPEIVSIYFIEDKDGNEISKEFCGGPHVSSTGVLGIFKILKEEAVSAGVRRIKAVLT